MCVCVWVCLFPQHTAHTLPQREQRIQANDLIVCMWGSTVYYTVVLYTMRFGCPEGSSVYCTTKSLWFGLFHLFHFILSFFFVSLLLLWTFQNKRWITATKIFCFVARQGTHQNQCSKQKKWNLDDLWRNQIFILYKTPVVMFFLSCATFLKHIYMILFSCIALNGAQAIRNTMRIKKNLLEMPFGLFSRIEIGEYGSRCFWIKFNYW